MFNKNEILMLRPFASLRETKIIPLISKARKNINTTSVLAISYGLFIYAKLY
ncbi:hypothetical protein [Nostoc sp. FACHB-280]|uniref:hypothetical protein n=1 Tax=Nostoc sp. FACHB-280 TaxID=2692839 RepID=UPI00168AC3D6|nr:hypothetical protein [Nostoc sp. FACHB-280]MBD2493614.1 hypothetical protein [Nostoc sp. FACHB-280]